MKAIMLLLTFNIKTMIWIQCYSISNCRLASEVKTKASSLSSGYCHRNLTYSYIDKASLLQISYVFPEALTVMMQLKWLQEALPDMLYRCSSVCTDWRRARGRLPLAAPRGGWTNGNGWGSRRWIAIGWNVGTCGVTTFTKWSTAKQHTVTFFRTCYSPTISQHHLPTQIVHVKGM